MLAHPAVQNLQLDPRLGLFEGRQHPPQGYEAFGVFADASPHHTFLVKRFDRMPTGRLHFVSAMALTGHQDGDDASTGASYLDIARVLTDHGAQTDADLHELWSRIVFNMLVSNTDDHLRNHGFILVHGKGWRLSGAYDMNPVPDAQGLKLNVSEADNTLELDLARSVAAYFRVSKRVADDVIARRQAVVKQWPKIAGSLEIPSPRAKPHGQRL